MTWWAASLAAPSKYNTPKMEFEGHVQVMNAWWLPVPRIVEVGVVGRNCVVKSTHAIMTYEITTVVADNPPFATRCNEHELLISSVTHSPG